MKHSGIQPKDLWLWGILGIQIALSLPGTSRRTLWVDEAYSAVLARRTFSEISAALAHDSGPPLYYDMLHVWRWLYDESEFALRSLSLVFALATTLLIYRLGALSFDRWAARISALIWAVHPLVVFYAGEARNYTLLAFLSVVLVSILTEEKQRHSLPILAFTLVALVYTHNIAWFTIASALIAALLVYRQRLGIPLLLMAFVMLVACYLPWIPTLQRQLANSEKTIGWMRLLWTPWSPIHSLGTLAPWGRAPDHTIAVPALSGRHWPLVALLWFAPSFGLLLRRAGTWNAQVRFLWIYLALGLVLPTVWSAMKSPIVMPGRTDFFVLPASILLIGAGLSGARPRLRIAGCAVLVTAAATASVMYHIRTPAFVDRPWIRFLQTQSRRGDVLVCTAVTRVIAEYYLRSSELTLLSFPRDMTTEWAHYNSAWYERHIDLTAEADRVVAEALSKLRPSDRLWVTVAYRELQTPLAAAIARDKRLAQTPLVVSSPHMGMLRMDMPVQLHLYRASSE